MTPIIPFSGVLTMAHIRFSSEIPKLRGASISLDMEANRSARVDSSSNFSAWSSFGTQLKRVQTNSAAIGSRSEKGYHTNPNPIPENQQPWKTSHIKASELTHPG